MSFVTILIIIGIISSVVKAMQSKKGTRSGERLSPFKQIVPSLKEQRLPIKRVVTGTHEKRGRGEVKAPARFLSPEPPKVNKPVREDRLDDFGDLPTVYSSIESADLTVTVPEPVKNSPLHLKPTSKKLAETLILAEILSEPRAKRPYHVLGYRKR